MVAISPPTRFPVRRHKPHGQRDRSAVVRVGIFPVRGPVSAHEHLRDHTATITPSVHASKTSRHRLAKGRRAGANPQRCMPARQGRKPGVAHDRVRPPSGARLAIGSATFHSSGRSSGTGVTRKRGAARPGLSHRRGRPAVLVLATRRPVLVRGEGQDTAASRRRRKSIVDGRGLQWRWPRGRVCSPLRRVRRR